MSVFSKIKSAVGMKPKAQTDYFPGLHSGWVNFNSGSGTVDAYKGGDYENAYPSISKISNRFFKIRPYAVDDKGERKTAANAVEKLYKPNQQMSSVDFREALSVMYLVHPKVYLLVWKKNGADPIPGGEIRNDNDIAGYTFLEGVTELTIGGKTTYTSRTGVQYTDKQVITLLGAFPYDLSRGYSATEAAKRWSSIDDYIADYQRGFFKNGAVPAGMFRILAATTDDYEDTVTMLQRKHRGAGNNNNVTYSHQPIDQNTGKPSQAQIEWIPFNTDNKNLDLKNVFDQVNQKIDSAFGVPASIRGVGENNNFATAQQDNRNFVENVVDPLATKIWTRMSHELNRITGGLGYAITYDLELPQVSEDLKVQAETRSVDVQTIANLELQGFTEESSKEYIATNDIRKLVRADVVEDDIDDDIDTGDEVEDAPDAAKVSVSNKLEVATRTNPKAVLTNEEKLHRHARKYMKAQVDRAIKEYDETIQDAVEPDPTDDELDTFVDEMMVTIIAMLIIAGDIQYSAGAGLLASFGIDTSDLTQFTLTDEAKDAYRAYMTRVGDSYGKDNAEAIRKVLAQSQELGLSKNETKKALRGIVDTDEWRVKRLADTETNRSGGVGSVESMKQIQGEANVSIEKSLFHPAGPTCQYCKALEGVWKPVDVPLVKLNESITGVDGGVIVNDFATNEGHDPHPNGGGVPIYRVAPATASASLSIKCGNSKCKTMIPIDLASTDDVKCQDCDRWMGTRNPE